MSRLFDFQIEAELPEGTDHDAIGKALQDYDSEFTPNWWQQGRLLTAGGNLTVCGGRRPNEVIDEISRTLWKAAGRFFEVKVSFVDLEDLPYETEIRDESDFERLVVAEIAVPTEPPAEPGTPPKKTPKRKGK